MSDPPRRAREIDTRPIRRLELFPGSGSEVGEDDSREAIQPPAAPGSTAPAQGAATPERAGSVASGGHRTVSPSRGQAAPHPRTLSSTGGVGSQPYLLAGVIVVGAALLVVLFASWLGGRSHRVPPRTEPARVATSPTASQSPAITVAPVPIYSKPLGADEESGLRPSGSASTGTPQASPVRSEAPAGPRELVAPKSESPVPQTAVAPSQSPAKPAPGKSAPEVSRPVPAAPAPRPSPKPSAAPGKKAPPAAPVSTRPGAPAAPVGSRPARRPAPVTPAPTGTAVRRPPVAAPAPVGSRPAVHRPVPVAVPSRRPASATPAGSVRRVPAAPAPATGAQVPSSWSWPVVARPQGTAAPAAPQETAAPPPAPAGSHPWRNPWLLVWPPQGDH